MWTFPSIESVAQDIRYAVRAPFPDADRLVVLIGNVARASFPDHADWRGRPLTDGRRAA